MLGQKEKRKGMTVIYWSIIGIVAALIIAIEPTFAANTEYLLEKINEKEGKQ